MPEILRNILLGLSLAAPLGPSGVAVIRSGLQRGFIPALLTGIGVTCADLTYLLLVFFGLSWFMEIAWVKALVWALGALFLIYMGAQSVIASLRDTLPDGARLDLMFFQHSGPTRHPLLAGYLVNISNPIAIVWWVGIYGSLLGTTVSRTRLEALLSSAAILIGILLWHTTTSLLSSLGRRYLSAGLLRVVGLVAGLALIGFGLRFAWLAVETVVG